MYLRTDAYADYLAGLCASRYQDSSDWANIAENYRYYLWHLDNDEESLYGNYGEEDGFWGVRDYTRNAANIKCPALIVHGLNDTVVYQKHFALMYDSYKKAGVDAKLLLTQNGHITLAFGENKTEQFVNGEAYQQVLNRWFTHYLYDIDNGADEMAAVTVQDNVDGSWDTYPSWETNESMSMAFSPNKIISNYDSSSGITNDNFVTKYTADNTDYSTVKVIDIKEDTTIGGTIQVSVTATPRTVGENLMLTAFLVDMSTDEFNAFVIDKSGGAYDKTSHEATGEIFDIGGGAESYTVVKLKPKSVNSKIIASGWIDLANPSAGYYSNTAIDEGEATLEEHTYNIYLNPTIYTVKEGHKLALVICTRDPGMIARSLYNRPYHNMDAEYSVLISDVKATIPVY
jgi:X-Pro dipeptidyl-peptidase